MAKKDNETLLTRAVLRRMGQLNHIGESKKAAREKYNSILQANAKADGKPPPPWQASPYIHGIETLRQYKKISMQYATWLAKIYPETKKLSFAHKCGYDNAFIQLQIDAGNSAWTIARTCAALAKLHGCSMGEIHSDRPQRKRKEITRGRAYDELKYSEDLNHYGDIIELCRATGVRRCELKTLTPADFKCDSAGNLQLHLDGKKNNTKGGRSRVVEILPTAQKRVREILNTFEAQKIMFPEANKRINVHGIRALFAQELYAAVARPKEELKGKLQDHKGRATAALYACRDGTGKTTRIYDRAALLRVSQSLGHNRADVTSTHYLK